MTHIAIGVRAWLLAGGLVLVLYAALNALNDARELYPPRVELSRITDQCWADHSSRARGCRPVDHRLVLEGAFLSLGEVTQLPDGSGLALIYPTPSHAGLALFQVVMLRFDAELWRRVSAALSNDSTLYVGGPFGSGGLLVPLSTLDGTLVSRDLVDHDLLRSLQSPFQEVPLIFESVTAPLELPSRRSYLTWLWLAASAVVLTFALLLYDRPRTSIDPSALSPRVEAKPREQPLVVSLRTVTTLRGLLMALTTPLPLLVGGAIVTGFGEPAPAFESEVATGLGLVLVTLCALIAFFVVRRLLDAGRVQWSAAMTLVALGLVQLVLHVREFESLSAIAGSVSAAATLALSAAVITSGILAILLANWRIGSLGPGRWNFAYTWKPPRRTFARNLGAEAWLFVRSIGSWVLELIAAFFFSLFEVTLVVMPRIHQSLSHYRHRLRWIRRRSNAVLLRDAVKSDVRSPVVILRSFEDDGFVAHEEVGGDASRYTFEEVITHDLWQYGPVLAIGRPGETAPQSGAAREYVADEKWKDRVAELMGRASCIVVIVHKTDGLRWEIQWLREAGRLPATLFVFPPLKRRAVAERWDALCDTVDWAGGGALRDLPDGTVAVHAPDSHHRTILTERSVHGLERYEIAVQIGLSLVAGWTCERDDRPSVVVAAAPVSGGSIATQSSAPATTSASGGFPA